jgi:hypothetical protein
VLALAEITVYWNKADPLTTSVAENDTTDELGNRVVELRVTPAVIVGMMFKFLFYSDKYQKL